jgi:hypothetical protein
MRKWYWIAPIVFMMGCSTAKPPDATSSQGSAKPAQAAVSEPAGMEIPAGTPFQVRLDQTISTRMSRAGDVFSATLAEPLVVGDRVVLPQGTRFNGHVTASAASGRFKGRARLAMRLDAFEYQGRQYTIETSSLGRVSANHKKRNAVLIGGGTGLGAAIGAIAGGGKGALIGAGAGAAAGTVGEAFTGKKQVTVPAETLLHFKLDAAVRV